MPGDFSADFNADFGTTPKRRAPAYASSAPVYEIPLLGIPQTFSATFPNGKTYQFRLIYQHNGDECWIMDIGDERGNMLVAGIPLVTGCDLLAPYAHLGLGVKMWVTTDAKIAEPPHWWNLGNGGRLWIEG